MLSTFLRSKIYDEAGKMPLNVQLFFYLIASISTVFLMTYWNLAAPLFFMLMMPFAMTLMAFCTYMPVQFFIGLISPKTHRILQAFLAYLFLLCAFIIIVMLRKNYPFRPFSALVQNIIDIFSRPETCNFLNFPAAFYLLILCLIYTILPPKLARQSIENILDDDF